jgi:uncharacterized membrane protein YedE/YeeE
MAGTITGAAPRAHGPGIVLGLAGTAAALVGITGIADPALLPLLAVAMFTGAVFVWLDFGFTGGFRAYLEQGDGRTLGAAFIVPAVAALIVLPVGTMIDGYGRFVAPVGLSLVIGAAIFGVGMQLTNGCGSGTLVALGQGSRRMLVALPFFCLGSVAGSLLLPSALMLPGIGAVDLAGLLGPWGGLAVTEALLLAGALVILRGARPSSGKLLAGAVIGGLAAVLFLVSGQPWGITMGLTVWGAKGVAAAGIDLSGTSFWSDPWMADVLRGPFLALHASTSNVGVIIGALLAAAAMGRLRHGVAIGWRGGVAAALGGLLMGIGARLSFGCNVGAFLGGASSGSLHGFVWIAAALPGCWVGLRLQPLFEARH